MEETQAKYHQGTIETPTQIMEVTGQRPRVNEAREFIGIAKDFKRPQELLREPLSNSWDAQAAAVSSTVDQAYPQRSAPGRRKQLLNIAIQDDGEGMRRVPLCHCLN